MKRTSLLMASVVAATTLAVPVHAATFTPDGNGDCSVVYTPEEAVTLQHNDGKRTELISRYVLADFAKVYTSAGEDREQLIAKKRKELTDTGLTGEPLEKAMADYTEQLDLYATFAPGIKACQVGQFYDTAHPAEVKDVPKEEEGSSTGAIVGIVAGVLALLGIIAGAAAKFFL